MFKNLFPFFFHIQIIDSQDFQINLWIIFVPNANFLSLKITLNFFKYSRVRNIDRPNIDRFLDFSRAGFTNSRHTENGQCFVYDCIYFYMTIKFRCFRYRFFLNEKLLKFSKFLIFWVLNFGLLGWIIQWNDTKRVFLSKLISLIKWCCFLNQFTKVTLRTLILLFGQIYSDKTFHARIRIYFSEKQN